MSEYWVSKKRYFCKYCDTYIADDVPSRQHHENGFRHKGNVERFVRGLYKAGEKQKKDAEEEKREMMRIERAANAAFAEDVGAGRAQHASSSNVAPRASTSSIQKPKKSGGISDYSTAESLGYTDPDIERARAEVERRRTQGVAGEWQLVESAPAEPSSGTSEETKPEHNTPQIEGGQEAANKRPLPDPVDEEEGRWKLRKKMATVGLGEIYDPGIISIKPKAKVEIDEGVTGNDTLPSTPTPSDTGATTVPKWAPVKWRKADEQVRDTNDTANPAPATHDSRTDEAPAAPPGPLGGEEESTVASVTDVPVKEEPVKPEEPPEEAIPAGGSLFRKRKTPARGGTNSSGRRF
ncbi:hypothetical protein EDB89DRAFT_1041945 [Lactarius sanguifluus]|nr:hypothetical protein EDB89DRAFT_1041945 [Lactarius sanguifluus]